MVFSWLSFDHMLALHAFIAMDYNKKTALFAAITHVPVKVSRVLHFCFTKNVAVDVLLAEAFEHGICPAKTGLRWIDAFQRWVVG